MRPFSEIEGRIARWETIERRGYAFGLRSGAVPFGFLRWEGATSAHAVAESHDRAWIFEEDRPGRRVLVREAAGGRRVGALERDGRGGGRLECESGASAQWVSLNSARAHWGFRTASGCPLLELRLDTTPWAPGAVLAFAPGAAHAPEAPLLASLGWHLALGSLLEAGAAAETRTGRPWGRPGAERTAVRVP